MTNEDDTPFLKTRNKAKPETDNFFGALVVIVHVYGVCAMHRYVVSSTFLKGLSIAALYCRQSEFCFRHFASGLPQSIDHLELVLRSSVARRKHSTS